MYSAYSIEKVQIDSYHSSANLLLEELRQKPSAEEISHTKVSMDPGDGSRDM